MSNKYAFSTTGSYFEFNGTKHYLTSLTFNQASDKIDVTDCSTTGDGKEFLYGRKERTFTAELWMSNLSGSSEPPLATKGAINIAFEGRRYNGSGSLESKEITGTIDNAIALSFAGSFDGAVTVTPA